MIFNQFNYLVGRVSFKNGKVLIKANSNYGFFDAGYPIPEINESEGKIAWQTNIKFKIKNLAEELRGVFTLISEVYPDLGVSTRLEPEVEYRIAGRCIFALRIKENIFRVCFFEDDRVKELKIDPQFPNQAVEQLEKLKPFFKIKWFRKGINLLDNLITICFRDYTLRDLFNSFWWIEKRMKFQDGTNNLTESYFAFNQNSWFEPLKIKKIEFKTSDKKQS